MIKPRSREGDGPSGLRVERVDLVSTELGVVLVRVSGRWEGGPSPDAPVLLVGERRFDALPETSGAAERAASGADAFRATFSVAEELRPALGAGVRLAVGEVEVELPAARDTETGTAEPAGATVVDRAVLAERRARRAELAEETIARRAEEAERALAELEGELAKLELRLERATDERAELMSRLSEATRDARAAAQRAEAERRRREESVAEASERTSEAEDEAARVRERAEAAGEQARDLGREVESMRRRIAEAEQAAAAAEAARARAEKLAGTAEAAAAERIAAERTATAMQRARTLAEERGLAARTLEAEPPPVRSPVARDAEAMHALLEAEARVTSARREPGDTGDLREEARHAAAAVADAAWTLVEARDAIGGVSGAVEAERALRSAVDAERELLARDLAAERAGAAELRAEIERRAGVQERAERAIDEMRGRIEELQGLSARARRADEAESALRQYSSAAGEALEEAERRIGEAREAAVGMQARVEEDRAQRDELESRIISLAGALQSEREARERAEAALAERAKPPEPAQPRPAPPRRREARVDPWLPRALRELAAREPEAAIRLGVQLLPAQTLAADEPLDYDLRVEGLGWHAVALGKGRGSIATLHKPRPRRRTDFRLALDAPALAELLAAGGSREVRRAGRVSVRGTLRRRRALRRLPAAPLDLADLAEAGVWPDPGLVLAALSLLVDPAWTEGEPLVVALEVVGPRGGSWTVEAPGGEPLVVTPGRPEQPSATVRIPQGAFQGLLAGRPRATPGKAAIRGDVAALGRLVGWIERAQRDAH
jgi:hypothetical protein